MNDFFVQFTSLLTEAPGNFIFHFVLAFSIASSLQVAFNHWYLNRLPRVRRTILGLSVLLLAQIVLFAISAMSWQALVDPVIVLPPLDRAITLFSLIWIAWLWIFPEPNRTADVGNVFLSLLVFAGLALSYLLWMPQAAAQTYNLTTQDSVWQFFSLGFIAAAGLMLFIHRPKGWINGFILLGLVFLGHSLYLLLGFGAGNFPGIARLFYVVAFPILLTLPQRLPEATSLSVDDNIPAYIQKNNEPSHEKRRYSTNPKTLHALLSLVTEEDANKINHAITRAIAQTMLADLCYIIYFIEDAKQMVIASGYDLIREENLEGFSLNKETIPMLANALQRGEALRLPQNGTSPDLQGLGKVLNLSNPGHLLSTPLIENRKKSIGGILLLSPYSNRIWNAEDQVYLENISTSLISIIQRGQKLDEIKHIKKINQEVSDEYRLLQIEILRGEKNELTRKLKKIEEDSVDNLDQSNNTESLHATQKEAQHKITKPQKENLSTGYFTETGRKTSSLKSVESNNVEQELKDILQEVANLQKKQVQTNLKMLELERESRKEGRNEQAEVIVSISQELRQPMSSIVGYADLLLGESVGILGALQRKFVERVKISTKKTGDLIDDIIQVATLERGLAELKPEPVNLNSTIYNAIAHTSDQTREKNISIHIELPMALPLILADKSAIQKILIYLLQNAVATSPVNSKITIRAQNYEEDGFGFLLIQVIDTGGGISTKDLNRVFSHLYRAENILIPGVGDTGIGLSIARKLTEAQKGRLWVNSERNIGATFNVLLPASHPNSTSEA